MLDINRQYIVSIIPARGGSKGILRKNLVNLAGRPLVDYTIQASLESLYITRTYVSSDCTEIRSFAGESGASVIERPAHLATDTASSESVLVHAVNTIRQQDGERPDILVLLQPTSPLRNSGDIDQALELFFDSKADALISGTEPNINPLKMMLVTEDGGLRTFTDDPSTPFKARQLLPRAFKPNGAIYIIRTELFMKTGLLIGGRTVPFYMDKIKSLDIDTPADLQEAGRLIQERESLSEFKGKKTCTR